MKLNLYIWRQSGPDAEGSLQTYQLDDVNPHMSFLEMLDVLNEKLQLQGEEPVAFDHDCREGICGACSLVVNGRPHGGHDRTTACQLHMRNFNDGDAIYIEPWRARAFPIVKDLVVDRTAMERIMQAGGFISVNTGAAQDANNLAVPKEDAELAMDAAACIGCGACIAACPNGSAMLFTAAKVSQFALLPQGQPEREDRVKNMVRVMEEQAFGACSNYGECQAACPKDISIAFIGRLNREFMRAYLWKGSSQRGVMKAQ